MIWEVEVRPRKHDCERDRVHAEYKTLTQDRVGAAAVVQSSRGYLLEGELDGKRVERLSRQLLVDPLTESDRVSPLEGATPPPNRSGPIINVLLKPGVMDPAAMSVLEAARDLGIHLETVRTFRRYYCHEGRGDDAASSALRRVLANDAIEQVIEGPLVGDQLVIGKRYDFRRMEVLLRGMDDQALMRISREGQLALEVVEMRAIRDHFRALNREPTDVELETLAQTWSEHCSHKTLRGPIDFNGRRISGLLKETIFAATEEVRRRLGPDDWCVSVFEDNAGVVRFDERHHICFKVETHNHPSAIEPYGGANTGLGGVIRDPPRYSTGCKACLQHRCVLLCATGHAERGRAARCVAPEKGDDGSRRWSAGLRQPRGHPDG